jgi:hypothetical protein
VQETGKRVCQEFLFFLEGKMNITQSRLVPSKIDLWKTNKVY